ncbi:uncharacterized protein LOC128018918 isoform X2 [Carassius gibelio]|uniref:uncharacterized protein LOC128018918 isoform X2 n=1 Tax=Carassius gibelio TaxID=101364 RepID=UPI0022779F10|nr:uncharacterized protein LOC128018918 isoform X2 [Carassius gibelio]
MENETTRSTEGLLELVHPGSATFNESILAPLRNNYLYEESKECFTYNAAHLIHNGALQKRYAAFRSEKREKGYSEQELEESYGFLLLDDANRARKIGETGLLVGQAKCTTLGDSLKGVYISKYSDCLDLKRWYDGKTGYIVLLKLSKGRVKEVTDNYTQNFTPPTAGYDCHISDQLCAVSSTTSSFLAYERTQYYMYELRGGSNDIETCPRHACPFAIVAFSYGKMSTMPELEQKSQDKTVFHYQPWIGQFKIESAVYDVGLQSSSGAWFPAKLPKTVQIDRAIGVSELKRTLPREIFETCIVGEVCIDGRCFNLYDIVSSKAKNDLAQIAQELKEKDMALVIPLEDSGFLILLHSSHLFSYEDAKSGKAAALQGMFIFPDSRTVPRDAKSDLQNSKVSTEIMQVIPALNYAEVEMEKCSPNQQGRSQMSLEKHLQDYGTLFHPGLLDVPTREASMFPDQFDVPGGFTLISPKWSLEAGTQLKSYFDEPCGFTIPVGRALELLTAGRQQRGDDHDDDVYYYISSPEDVPQTEAPIEMEVTKQSEAISDASDRTAKTVEKQKYGLGKLGTAVVTVADSVLEYPTSTVSPKLGDVPAENFVIIENHVGKKSQGSSKGDADEVGVDLSKETIQTSNTPLIRSAEEGATALSGGMEDNTHPEKAMPDPDKKVNRRSFSRRRGRKRRTNRKTKEIKKVQKQIASPTSSLPVVLPADSPDDPTKDQIKTETVHADDINQRPHPTHRGKGCRRNLTEARQAQDPLLSVTTKTIDDQSIKNETSPSKKNWRSLPRRKRLWNTDANLKRSLRSDAVKNHEETTVNVQHNETKQMLSSSHKRKMEGFNLRERYGLKTIITNCGRVFVPHGSDVDVESTKKEKMHVEMSIDTNAEMISPVEKEVVEIKGESPSTGKEELPSKDPLVNDNEDSDSPSEDMPSALLSALRILRKLNKTNPSESDKSQDFCPEKSMNATSVVAVDVQKNNKDHPIAVQADATSNIPGVSDQSTHSDQKVSSPDKIKKKAKRDVYSAISISKLKTVLRRGKSMTSPSPGDGAKAEPDNTELESKKVKLGAIMDLKCDIAKNELKDEGLQPMNDEAQHTPMKSVELTQQPVSWRGLIHKASKENGSLNFDTSAPFEIAKHTDQQVMSSLIGDRVGRRRISTDCKASAERMSTGASLPPDALSLLADLALGASNDKMLTNLEAKAGLEAIDGVNASSSPESVLHALLRYPSNRFKLPPRSPFPEGLLVTGELILEISKEHSYSQTTSPLSGLLGPYPKVSFPSGSVESPLSLKTGLHLNLPKDGVASCYQEEVGKAEWKHLISPNKPMSEILKTKPRRPRILRNRSIIEKEGMIQVTRTWKEPYDFKFDSKFTNESKDKTVTRALHGKWNFSIEDTYEDVHLIFHMWIGLFYSKTSSRLFHLENSTALSKEKEAEIVHLDINAIQNAVSLLNVDLTQKADSSKPVHVSSEVLDLSVKNEEPVNLRSVSNRCKSIDTASQPGEMSSQKHEMAPRRSPSGTGLSSSPKVTALMNYRSAVDIPVASSVPDSDNGTDDENYITTDCSYSQLLEKNSAYNYLCEQASNMRIGVRILQPKVKNVANNKASTSVTSSGPPKIGVFHQILCPIKPSAFSKPNRLILGRKSVDLGLKNETGHMPHVILQKEIMPDSAHSKEVFEAKRERKKDGCSEAVVAENVDKTLELKTGASVLLEVESVSVPEESKVLSKEDSRHGCLTIMEDENTEEIITYEMPSQDHTSIVEHKETAHAKDNLKPLIDLKDHANMVDELRDAAPHETVEEHNEMSNAMEEPKPLLDDTNLFDHADELSDISSDETSNANEEFKPVHDLKDHANMADELNDALSEETTIEECNEFSNAKDQSNVVDASSHEIKGNDTNELVEEKEAPTGEEMMQEIEMKSKEEANLDGSDTECETSTAMEAHLDELALGLRDDLNCVNMEFSDEDSETKVPIEVYVQNSSIDKSSAFIDDDHDMKMQKSEKQPPTSEEANLEDDALEEFSKDSCQGDQLMSVLKKHTPAANNDTSEVVHDESKTMTIEQSIVVQQEALDICQAVSKPTSNAEPTKIDMSHSENDDGRDLGQQDAPEVTGEGDTLVDENETQSQGCCKDQIIETYKECLSPKICASPPNTTTDFIRNEAVARQALTINKPSEAEVNSICSTPTQDEIPCYPEINKGFREVDMNRDLYYPDNTDHSDMLPPKSPVSPHPNVSTMTPLSDFTGHYEEIHSDNQRWKRSKYPGTMDFKDKYALTTEHSPSEDPFALRHRLYPTSQQKDDETRNFIDSASLNDSELYYRDDLHGYYHRSDEDIPWQEYQTEESIDHQSYPCENHSGGDNFPPSCSKYITYEREYSYKHKKRAKKETDDYCWAEENYKSDPLSFKCPIKVTCTADSEMEINRSSKKKSRKSKFPGDFNQNAEWNDKDCSDSIQKMSSFETYQTKPARSVTVGSFPHVKPSKQQFDWRRYFRREATCSQLLDASERDDKFDIPLSSIVTILDRKGNRVIFSNSPTMKPSFDGGNLTKGLEDSFNDWQEQRRKANVTRSALDLEYLIFSENIERVLKETKSSASTTSSCRSNPDPVTCPMTVQFSNFSEVENSVELCKAQQSLTDFKIKVDMSDRTETREIVRIHKPLQRPFCEKSNDVKFSEISEITEQCAFTYKSMINDVCSGKTLPRPAQTRKRKFDQESVSHCPRFRGRVKKEVFDNLKSTVKQASKIKYRFYILVTSTDTFFEETKNLLEIEGHIPVEPDEFDLNGYDQAPLLIILRNEDIAEHICKVPYLLELKKLPSVLFAGIDRPDDVVNLTHQELFAKGGFIVCDELALDTLTLDDMKKVVGILEELDKLGKWKWFLHYRDSRRLRENARSSLEGSRKQQFIDCCQKAGIVEVLPYHDCDVMSRDRPDYLFCLTRLQIQNASVRFPVFITDTPTESFGTNGILTMNIYTFSRILSNDTCSVS